MSSSQTREHEKHLAEMTRYYARTASRYNLWHGDLSARGPHNFAVDQMLRLVRSKGYQTVLDVCCGTGRAVKACVENGVDAHGVDASSELIKEGVKAFGLSEDRFTCADATRLPFPDGSFDVSCVLGALHHCAIPEQIVAETLRVTRHAVVISDEGNHLHGGIRTLLQRLGVFNFVYRIVFRRPPRTARRAVISDEDGPAYIFSIEEIMPALKREFETLRSCQFYRVGKSQVASKYLPRLFARNVVVVADGKRSLAEV